MSHNGSNQSFNFEAANQLKSQLASEVSKIETDLNNMMRKVENARSWWTGGSEEAFINNFKGTKTNIVSSLQKCIADYQMLIDKVQQAKRQSDDDLSKALNKF